MTGPSPVKCEQHLVGAIDRQKRIVYFRIVLDRIPTVHKTTYR